MLRTGIGIAVMVVALDASMAMAQPTPPRTISDITALLEQHKPDPVKGAALKSVVDRQPPDDGNAEVLARFYRERANAAQELGMVRRQIADLRRALESMHVDQEVYPDTQQGLFHAELDAGNFLSAWKLKQEMVSEGRRRHRAYADILNLATVHLRMGDVAEARIALQSAEAQFKGTDEKGRGGQGGQAGRMDRGGQKGHGAGRWAARADQHTAQLESARGDLLEAEGKLAQAETAYRRALAAREKFLSDAADLVPHFPGEPPRERHERSRDGDERKLAFNLLRQGRLAEAEVTARDLLKRSLSRIGRYAPGTAKDIQLLAEVLTEQGRFGEAEAMARASIDTYERITAAPDSLGLIAVRRTLGGALVVQQRWAEALSVYEDLRRSLGGDPVLLQQFGGGDVNWALALIRSNRAAEAVAMLEPVVRTSTERLGADHYQPAEQRGFLALALAEGSQHQRALEEYRASVRVLLAPGRGRGQEGETASARTRRLVVILEGYIKLLHGNGGAEGAAEAFLAADAMRGHAVQGAMAASAARAAAGTPALAELIRREQDAKQQVATLHALLLRMLDASPDQQLPQVTAQIRARIAELQKEQRILAADVQKRFPAYVDLINPRPATVERTRAVLREGEVLVSLLVAGDLTYVWAVARQGAVALHVATLGEKAIGRALQQLRRALDPGVVPLERFPEFDVNAASRLYAELLKPVEATWKGAHTLLVVANGPLAQLPFGLLPTAAASSVDAGLRFARYRNVPWLIRHIGVTQLPAVNTLVTLRTLPQGNAMRSPFAGFGDPHFGGAAVPPESVALRMRNLAVTRAGDGKTPTDWMPYSRLAPLPDTREEILAIASALKADTAKDVFLGAQASKQNVKGANLATRRIVAFATHGLIPGDFPNLDEPALALSSPDGKAETGLLTLGDILGLKLDADWVVLSACNTAAGDGAGAEAISGLGRGFFYAGSRALLVTHWPVETRSARQLVTTLFERYAADPKLSRAEALRQASLAVMEDTAKDASGKPLFSYAHPLFWAPYALVGDGGR